MQGKINVLVLYARESKCWSIMIPFDTYKREKYLMTPGIFDILEKLLKA